QARRHDASGRTGNTAVARLARASDLWRGCDHGAPSPSLRVQQSLPAEAHERGLALPGLLARRARRNDRAAESPVLPRKPVPPRVPLHAARRTPAVHGFHEGRTRTQAGTDTGGGEWLSDGQLANWPTGSWPQALLVLRPAASFGPVSQLASWPVGPP